MIQKTKNIAVIGGGAAGYFAAIHAAEQNPESRVVIFEATKKPLAKVLVSGGGRCNVTHHCFEAGELVKHYPRGAKELRGAFSRFQPNDTIAWYSARGVELKVEADGRMFPTTDNSETIAHCLQDAAARSGVKLRVGLKVRGISKHETGEGFVIETDAVQPEHFAAVILATGGGRQGFELAASLGHTIVSPVPSLFTFEIKDPRLAELSGLSFSTAKLKLIVASAKEKRGEAIFEQAGPVLITHWGLSGPAVIKLSALAARELFEQSYQAKLKLNFLPQYNPESLLAQLLSMKEQFPKKELKTVVFDGVAKRYWLSLLEYLALGAGLTWADVSKKQLRSLAEELTNAEFAVRGKGVFKEEFVTCGGVSLKEVDFRTMQSRICLGLYFAGEVLDIDGITGGFNFQAAWTTGWIAGGSVRLQQLS